ncbi:MAG TPA: ornithine carbamoyltransferase [Acidobacteriaceae bacterium]|nr:ornithine carbamoyltransferase [Acidobacteriaceae bacterium]
MTTKHYPLKSPKGGGESSSPSISTLMSTAPANPLARRDLCSITDLSPSDIRLILDVAHDVKAQPQKYRHALDAKQLAMFFEKESLRTRITFEAGINTLGGSAIFIDQTASRLGDRETLADVAHNLERWVDVIVLRTYAHETITGMAQFANVPVVNALSDLEHPCQALTDIFTLEEHFGDLHGLQIAYVGDGNNVARSLLLTAAGMGAHISFASPEGYGMDANFLATAQVVAEKSGSVIRSFIDPREGVKDADAVYTDAWTSMGQEHETILRQKLFKAYQVSSNLMALAAPHSVFMHCLPAHRGEEVTDEVIDSAQSIVFDQAENRLHVQKAILLLLLDAAHLQGNGSESDEAKSRRGIVRNQSSIPKY